MPGCSRCGKTGTVIWDAARNKRQRLPPREENAGTAAQCRTVALAPAGPPAIVTLPAAKPGAGRGRLPLDGPALSHPGSRRRFSCATPGPRPRQRACRVSRLVKAYGQVVLSANGQSERWSSCVRYSRRSDIHRALLRQKSEERGKRRYSDEERFEWSSPVLPMALVLAAELFCRLLPAYGQEQAVYFVRLAPPQDANHTVCALINHTND
jgi:hypothetical protein